MIHENNVAYVNHVVARLYNNVRREVQPWPCFIHFFDSNVLGVKIMDKDPRFFVYYICTPVNAKRNYNQIRHDLQLIKKTEYESFIDDDKKETPEKVFVAYFENEHDLHVLTSEQFDDCQFDKTTFSETAESMLSFYKVIHYWCGDNKFDSSHFFFRGHSVLGHSVPVPGIYRNDNIKNEDRIFREAVRRMPDEFPQDMSTFDKLVKMQHYELPTRLLDVTSNPLVALYFACQNDKCDGEVLVYSMLPNQIKYYDDDVVCLLANLAKRQCTFDDSKRKEHSYLSQDIQNDSPSFNIDDMWNEAVHKVYCVLPKLNNSRIKKTRGRFLHLWNKREH